MKKSSGAVKVLAASFLFLSSTGFLAAQGEGGTPPKSLLPEAVIEALIAEVSGEAALQNEILLTGVNRNRLPEEYVNGYFETDFILRRLKEYGVTDSRIIDLPGRAKTTWDAESAELWLLTPERRKLADLRDIAATLASGSATTDTRAEIVYVGPGNNERYYQGKDVAGKILLVSGPPEMPRRIGVEKHGALGLVSFAGIHPDLDSADVLWGSIRPGEKDKLTFAFMIPPRLGHELRRSLERGTKLEVRAVCRTQQVPYKDEMVEGLIPGAELPQEELVLSAHLFEGYAKQGANDDASGCVVLLETARALKRLVDTGRIPPLKRSVRLLFVPEISGTIGYLRKFPDRAARLFAGINEDMVGEGLIKNNAYFVMKRTPDSLPSYLNDVLAALIEWLGETQKQTIEHGDMLMPVVSPMGSRDPFYYSIDDYVGMSDHMVYDDGGVRVPAVMLNIWPDLWYHTSGDTPDKSDSTQLKRSAFLSAAAAVFLAGAGPEETLKMLHETSVRAAGRLAREERRAESLIVEARPELLPEAYKEAQNIVDQGSRREALALASTERFVRGEAALAAHSAALQANIAKLRAALTAQLNETYRFACLKAQVKPVLPVQTRDEARLAGVLPVRTAKMTGYFDSFEFYERFKDSKIMPSFESEGVDFEIRNFIDGRRSILDIRNAVSAELGPVKLSDVEAYLRLLADAGYIELKKK